MSDKITRSVKYPRKIHEAVKTEAAAHNRSIMQQEVRILEKWYKRWLAHRAPENEKLLRYPERVDHERGK